MSNVALNNELIGKRVKIWLNYAPIDSQPNCEGRVIGFYDHPTVIVEDERGRQSTHFSQLRIEIVEAPPEPPTGSAVATQYTVWLRGHGGWFDGFSIADKLEFLSWEELNARWTVRRLVYDDAAADAGRVPQQAGGDSRGA